MARFPIIAGVAALALIARLACAAPEGPSVGPPAGQDDDVVLWTTTQNATDTAPYKEYLARFPNGAYAPMARAKLDALMILQAAPPADKGAERPPAAPVCVLEGAAGVGDVEAEACRKCHVFEAGRPSRSTGPNLVAVFGARAASVADFKFYSAAMRDAGRKGLVWDAETLDAYLRNPGDFLEKRTGNSDVLHNMFFKLTDAAKRAQVVAYIQSLARCR